MLTIPPSLRIFLATMPTDMRKSFDGLQALAQEIFEQDPLSGHLFLFINRRRDRLKALFWDADGMCIWYKRLERGTFEIPRAEEGRDGIEIDRTRLSLLLGGIELATARQRKRYRRVG